MLMVLYSSLEEVGVGEGMGGGADVGSGSDAGYSRARVCYACSSVQDGLC